MDFIVPETVGNHIPTDELIWFQRGRNQQPEQFWHVLALHRNYQLSVATVLITSYHPVISTDEPHL